MTLLAYALERNVNESAGFRASVSAQWRDQAMGNSASLGYRFRLIDSNIEQVKNLLARFNEFRVVNDGWASLQPSEAKMVL